MVFQVVSQVPRSFSHVREVRFSISKTPSSRIGRVVIPPTVLKNLGWGRNIRLEVLSGTGEDNGWFIMKPAAAEARYRAKLYIATNGVGRFNSSSLAPDWVTGPVNSRTIEIATEGDELRLNLFPEP